MSKTTDQNKLGSLDYNLFHADRPQVYDFMKNVGDIHFNYCSSWLKDNDVSSHSFRFKDNWRKEYINFNEMTKLLDDNAIRFHDLFVRVNWLFPDKGVKKIIEEDGRERFPKVMTMERYYKKLDRKHPAFVRARPTLGISHNWLCQVERTRFVIDIDSDGLDPLTLDEMKRQCERVNLCPMMLVTTHFGGFHIVLQGDYSFDHLNYRLAMATMLTGEDPSLFGIDLRRRSLTSSEAKPLLDHLKVVHCIDPQVLIRDPKVHVARVPGSVNHSQTYTCDGGLVDPEWFWEEDEIRAWLSEFYAPAMYRSAVVIPINFSSTATDKVIQKESDGKPLVIDETSKVRTIASKADIETIAAVLDDKALNLKKEIRYQLASYLAKGVGWLVKQEPSFTIAQVKLAGEIGLCQKQCSSILKKLVMGGYLRRSETYVSKKRAYDYCFGDKFAGIEWQGSMVVQFHGEYTLGNSNDGMLQDVRAGFALGWNSNKVLAFITEKYQRYVACCHPKDKRKASDLRAMVQSWERKRSKA